jgi:hypothetical protein
LNDILIAAPNAARHVMPNDFLQNDRLLNLEGA